MNHLFLFHYFVNPLIIIIIGRFVYGKFKNVSFPGIFILFYFITQYIRAVQVYEQDYRELFYLISIWIVPYLFIFGVIISLLGWQHSQLNIKLKSKGIHISKTDLNFVKYTKYISLYLIILPIIFILDKGIKSIPLFYLIINRGNSIETMHLRLGGLKSNFAPILTTIYSYSRSFLYPLYLGILTLFFNNKLISRNHLIIVCLSGVLFSSMTASKAPSAVILFSMVLSYYLGLSKKGKKIKVLFFAFLSLFIPAMIYPLMYGIEAGHPILVALSSLWRRISIVPSRTSAAYFSIFKSLEKVKFSSNRFFAFVFGLEYFPLASFVYNFITEDSKFQGGLVNASFYASFYADWGISGVVFGSILVGFIVGQLQVFFDRSHNDLIGTGFKSFTMIGMMFLLLTNFYSSALGRGFISAPLVLYLISFKNRKIKYTTIKSID